MYFEACKECVGPKSSGNVGWQSKY